MISNKIVFIPTAGNVEPYTGYIDEGVEMLKSLGYELKIIDISKYDEDYLKNKLSKTECICIHILSITRAEKEKSYRPTL